MRYDVLRGAEKYTRVHKRKRLRHRVVTVLAGVVVFCTTYALILPAITLEKQCDIPEHTHTDACYAQVTSVEKRVPVCSAETLEIHRHTADCCDADGNPTCGYAEFVVHSHDSRCYDETGNLWCPLPEIEAHRHTADCYALPEGHTHAEGCYTSVRGNLVCGEHVHTDACYTETAVLACGLEESEEHQHDENCYETSRERTCGIDSDHSHTDACYEWEQVLSCDLPTDSAEDAQPVLVCTKPEIVLHRHTPDCFDADSKLICGQTQILEHRHSDACFETVAEPVDTGTLTCTDTAHVHTARCYGTWELVCGQEEHTHSEACTQNEQEETVFCGKDAHTHGEACRDENGELVCGTEEHTHSLACYADPGADVETAELWEQTFAGVTLTGNWRQDTLAIAETQLGYAESTKNYVVAEDGETVKGYTRYGAWCEEPYGDWNVMFLTFCLHYAGVEGVPPDRDCGGWVTSWADAFEPVQSHTPAAGDLVLFDRDGDGTADRAGLVAQTTDSGFAAMEGDAEDAVRLLTYGADDPGILGYINLPEGPKEFTLTAQTENGITVTITGESASLPYPAREITVTVTEVTDGERRAIRDQILGEEQAEPERSYLLDITLWHGEEEIEPTGSVTVTFSGIDTEGLYPKVYHIDTNAQTATDMEAKTGENGDVTVDTDHFSLYEVQARSFQDLSGYVGDKFSEGGNFKLTGDAWTADNGSSANLSISKDTTIDLNGRTLTISKSGQCFEVQDGATLTIVDSAAPQETVTNSDRTVYGNKATLENDTLTYYITTSTPSGTGTTETLEQHTVTLTGAIRCDESSDQAIKVNGGTLDIQGGALRNSSGKRIVLVESGTLTMEGGYIVGGGSQGNPGGGIYVTNGTLNISGGVVAANRGNSGGGIFVNSGTLNISGGAVAGNEVINGHSDNGGGIYVNSGTLNLSGGYVTNNYKACDCNDCRNDVNNTHGGGGIALANSSVMNMTGGYVTGNYSGLVGGGIYAGFFGHNVRFTMSGGTIAGNCAELGEGGGLRIAGGTNGVIQATNKVYITNNITNSNNDWGGGGIFVQEKGNLSIVNSLITNNSAGGFGGGVGACPTGETLVVNQDGAAIYENRASGTNMSGGGNNKTYDSTLAQTSEVFTRNGYADYFCVRARDGANGPISLVTGLMAGGGAANWTGSCDEQPVSIGPSGYAAAKYLFGLDAHPDGAAKSQAVNAAKVIITGNHSNIHGGGIMTNGGLILGRKEEIVTATPALDITGTKALLKDGAAQESGRDFHFLLKNSTGEEVGTATADAATGQFTISPNVQYTQAGTYTYTLSEVNDNRPGITYDTNVHTIQVTIEEKTVSLLGVTFKSYNVSSVTLDGSESGGSSGSGGDSQTGTFKVRYQNTNNWANVNVYVWEGNNKPAGEWPGKPMTMDTDGTYYYDLNVTGTGTYNYIFNNKIGDSGTQTKDITNVPYAPGKEVVFKADGSIQSNTAAGGSSGPGDAVGQGSNSDGSYTLTIPGDAFTNTMTTQLNLQITKTDSADASKLLEGAKFTLKEQGIETSVEVTTGKDGIALFSGIRRNTIYDLRETQAPSNYMTAGPWILEVGEDGSATLYPATEKAGGTLEKASNTGTALTVTTGTDSKVLELPIQDTPWGYELPDTGGAGTTSYTAGGLTLIFGAATLLYIHCRRRKEDEASS